MKLQQEENKVIITNCKNCAFAVYNENTQTGCAANRIDKFKELAIEAYDNDKEFFIINRFCNLYRDNDQWANKDISQAFEEIKVSFNIMINCNGLNEEYISWIELFLNECIKYNQSKCVFNIYHNHLLTKDQKQDVLKLCKMVENYNLSLYFDKDILEHNLIYKSTKTYSVIITKNNRPNIKVLDSIDKLINIDLRRALVINSENNKVISNLAYKIQYLENTEENFENIILNTIEKSKPIYYFEL